MFCFTAYPTLGQWLTHTGRPTLYDGVFFSSLPHTGSVADPHGETHSLWWCFVLQPTPHWVSGWPTQEDPLSMMVFSFPAYPILGQWLTRMGRPILCDDVLFYSLPHTGSVADPHRKTHSLWWCFVFQLTPYWVSGWTAPGDPSSTPVAGPHTCQDVTQGSVTFDLLPDYSV